MNKLKWKTILSGLPITSSRGFVGWSSVSLINFNNHLGLFDAGAEGAREPLLNTLKSLGIKPSDLEFIIFSHLHFDHFINVELFPNATLYTTQEELNYALSEEPHQYGDFNYTKSSLYYYKSKFTLLYPKDQIYEGEIVALPGHTKGSIGFETGDCIFTGDALKYATEAKNKSTTYAYYNKQMADESIRSIVTKNKIIIPGHDPAFKLENDNIVYLNDASVEIYKRKDSCAIVLLKEV
jgi:glyoxylase-like metal-dependent hydrolase (beta-lactamase superfamily II)